MIDAAFTSISATTNIANRTIREAGRHAAAPYKTLAEFVIPIAKQLAERGKISRQELWQTYTAMVRRLHTTENIIDIDVSRISPSRQAHFSLKECCNVRFVQMHAMDNDWMEFIGCDVKLTRHRVDIFVKSTDFLISAHLLARYMQRQKATPIRLMATIGPALRMASLLSSEALKTKTRQIALPVAEGLLVGDVTGYRLEGEDRSQTIYTRDGLSTTVEEGRMGPGYSIVTWAKSFIAAESFTPRQQAVFDSLCVWEATHRAGIEVRYEATVFGEVRVAADLGVQHHLALLEPAKAALREIIAAQSWR